MNRALLLAAASMFALSGACASAMNAPVRAFAGRVHPFQVPEGAQVLYNQNSNGTGYSVGSQNFTSGSFSGYDDQGADDFVVPKGMTWMITQVDVSGVYFNGKGPAASEDVIFYQNRRLYPGQPGKPVKHGTFRKLKGKDDDGSFAMKLPHEGLSLAAGTYWISVIANCSYEGDCGQWGWETNSVQHGYAAMWRSPGNCCCPSWGTLQECVSGDTAPDFMFDLRGSARRSEP